MPPKKKQRVDLLSSRPVRQRQRISTYSRPVDSTCTTEEVTNVVTDTSSQQPSDSSSYVNTGIDYPKLAAEIIKQQNSNNLTSTASGDMCNSPRRANLLPPLTSDPAITNTTITSGQGMVHPNYTSGSDPSEEHNDISQTSTLFNNRNIPPNVLPSNDWQSNPLMALVNSIFSNEPANLGNHNISQDLSLGIPLGANLSQKMKNKIWSHEYIDLKALVSHVPEDNISLTLSQNQLTVQNTQLSKSKDQLTFSEWKSAFHIYMAVFIEKFSDQAPHMLKYMEMIKGIRQSKGDEAWKFYDDQFRRLRKLHMPPWQKPIDELYNVTMNKKYFSQPKQSYFNSPRNNTTPGQSNLFRGQKLCFAFNLQRKCATNPCPYKHACKFCKGPHPQLLCTKTVNNATGTNTAKTYANSTKTSRTEYELAGYDSNSTKYLVSGFRKGFKLGLATGTVQHSTAKNHKSASENKQEVYKKLAIESLKERIAGPFLNPPFQNLVCSPLGLIPKNIPGKFRLIHDLSFPKGNSINSHIPSENSAVQYDSIDTVIKLIKHFGRHCLMAKCDIEDAFRLVPIHPTDYHLLGFTWNNLYYYDRCLPMGASSSCQIFESFSSSLHWIMENKYCAAGMSHIIDDFLFVGPPNSDKCLVDLQCFSSLCSRLGVPLKPEKTILPTTTIVIYGIEFDSNKLECRLPVEKIVKTKVALENAHKKKKITLRSLQSLIGLLNFACIVICPGRAFLRRLIDLTLNVSNPFHKIRLNSEARADISAWKIFIETFNGKSVFLKDHWQNSESLNLYTDASGNVGFAAVFGSWWLAGEWLSKMQNYQIAIKELFPIVLSLEIWGDHLKNGKIMFHSDNMAVVEIINKQTCKDKVLMRLVRRLVIAALTYNIVFRAKHIKGKTNVIADYLSRSQFQKARALAPWLAPHQTAIPDHLLHI